MAARATGLLGQHWLVCVLLAAGLMLRMLAQVVYRPPVIYVDMLKYLYGRYPGSEPLTCHYMLKIILAAGDLRTVALAERADCHLPVTGQQIPERRLLLADSGAGDPIQDTEDRVPASSEADRPEGDLGWPPAELHPGNVTSTAPTNELQWPSSSTFRPTVPCALRLSRPL